MHLFFEYNTAAKYILMPLSRRIGMLLFCLLLFISCLGIGQTIPSTFKNNRYATETINGLYDQALELLEEGKERKKAYNIAKKAMQLSNDPKASKLEKWKASFIYEYARQEYLDEHAEPFRVLSQLVSEVNTTAPNNKALRRNIYHSLTSSSLLLNKLDSAVFFAEKADDLGRELFGESSCERITDLYMLAYALMESAQDEQALIVTKKALNIAESTCSQQSAAYIDAHRLMGYYYIKSNYKASKAIPFYQRALRVSMHLKDADRAFKSLYYICRTALLSDNNKLLEEHIHFFDTIQLFSDHITSVKCDLARLDIEFTMARRNKDLTLAILKKHQFKELLLTELPERETAIFESYYSIVDMSIKNNSRYAVMKYLTQLEEYVSRHTLNQDQLLSYYQIKSDGGVYTGQWSEVLAATQKGVQSLVSNAINIEIQLPEVSEVSDLFFYRLYLINYSKYFEHQFEQRRALNDLIKQQEILRHVIRCVTRMIERDDERMSKQLTESIADDFEQLISVDMKLYELTQSQKYVKEAFQLTDVASNLTFFRGANQRRAMTRTLHADSLIELRKTLKQELISLQLNQNNGTSLSAYHNEKEQLDLSIKIAEINLYFEEHEPLYMSNIRAINTVSIDSFQKNTLDSTMAFVQYFYYNRLYVYLVLKNKVVALSLPTTDDFLKQISDYRQCISSPNSGIDSFSKYSRSLGSVLLDSLLEHLPARIDKLIIAPYGNLSTISFEGLLYQPSTDNRFAALPYLVKKYAISYAFSMTSYYRGCIKENQKIGDTFLGVCPSYRENPVAQKEVGRSTSDELFHLQGAENEVKALGKLIKKRRILIGEDATKEQVIDNLGNYAIWHFAMHALVDEDNPMLSSLYLANQGVGDSKVLTAAEIYTMQLETDMVVLSACNTGVGQYDYVQGTMSLARAFAYAGARSTILSFWPAPDQATSEFFPMFYDHLIAGESKTLALQHTKKEWLNQPKSSQFHHPYYWSTFTLWGNTESLSYLTRRSAWLQWDLFIGVGCCLLIGSLVFYLIRSGWFRQTSK